MRVFFQVEEGSSSSRDPTSLQSSVRWEGGLESESTCSILERCPFVFPKGRFPFMVLPSLVDLWGFRCRVLPRLRVLSHILIFYRRSRSVPVYLES